MSLLREEHWNVPLGHSQPSVTRSGGKGKNTNVGAQSVWRTSPSLLTASVPRGTLGALSWTRGLVAQVGRAPRPHASEPLPARPPLLARPRTPEDGPTLCASLCGKAQAASPRPSERQGHHRLHLRHKHGRPRHARRSPLVLCASEAAS